VTDVIAAVVKEEPDLDSLPPKTPRVVHWLITRCLRKDPRTRLPDIGAARLALQDVLAGTAPEMEALAGDTEGTGRAEGNRRVRERWAWAVAVVAAGVAATFAFVHLTEVPDARPATHFVVDAPEGWSFTVGRSPVPSPDGRHVVIRAEQDDPEPGAASAMLWLRSLESPTVRPLPGTEGTLYDGFWSPDSRSVGFLAGGEVRKLSLADDVVQIICTLPTRFGSIGDWNADGTILFGSWPNLYTVTAAGGEAKLALKPDAARGESALQLPQFLPDGRRFLFLATHRRVGGRVGGVDFLGVHVGSLDSPDERRLLAPEMAHFEEAGEHILFNRGGTLLAQPFDSERAELSGEPAAITSSVAAHPTLGMGLFGVSPGGTLAYLSGETERRVQLTWVDRQGQRLANVGEPGPYNQIALSPDESRVAFEVLDAEGQVDLWVIDTSRGVASRLTSDPGNELDPLWSPDGRELVFKSVEEGNHRLFRKGLHGDPAVPIPERSGAEGERIIPESWLPDGKTLLYQVFGGTTIWARPLERDGEAEAVLEVGFNLDEPQVSPDGRWLAYVSEESGEGEWEVFVQPFGRTGEKVRVSVAGGGEPRWRADSKELFYRTPGGQLMAVDVREGVAGPEIGLPTALFDLAMPQHRGLMRDDYAVSADGQRFLVKVPIEDDRKLQMHVVLNWESLLESGE
jgi:Tol biopolymer transport system component